MLKPLEARRFLSVAPGASISRGRTLYVRGSDAADTIMLARRLDGSADVTLSVNGIDLGVYLPREFRRVQVEAGDGDDAVELAQAGRPAEVHAGAGDDTVTSPDGSDALFDNGSGAASIVWGGDGDDSLAGGNQSDRLLGEGGDDTLFGARGFDVLNGGAGSDTWRPSRGSDFTSALETREDGGATVIHDDLEPGQLYFKATR